MARGVDTGDHPRRKVGRGAFSDAPVTPTPQSEMREFDGPRCNNCGSFNTDLNEYYGGYDCHDCARRRYKYYG